MTLALERLELLQRLAEQREQRALQALTEKQQRRARNEAMQRELQGYLQGYESQPSQTVSSALLLNQKAFTQRLHQALTAQNGHLQEAQSAENTERHLWLESKRKLMIAEQMRMQAEQRRRRHHERRSQLECDEMASQQWLAASRS